MFDVWIAVPYSVGFLIALLRCFVVLSSIEHVASVCPRMSSFGLIMFCV